MIETGARTRVLGMTLAFVLVVAACSSSGGSKSSSGTSAAGDQTTSTAAKTLQILVTNDDGVSAPGIDAVVEGLKSLDGVKVTVVAPLTNQSGSGGKTTSGPLTVTDAKTASGYPAKAVAGYPADTITWAVTDKNVSPRPDVVVSGVNFGQNIGPLVDISGTVGAARAAAAQGIPALASSAGLPPPGVTNPDYPEAVKQVEAWITSNRAGLLGGKDSSPVLLENLNVPTCAAGLSPRGLAKVPTATSANGLDVTKTDCSSTATNPTDDVVAYTEGFEPLSPLSLTPASSSG